MSDILIVPSDAWLAASVDTDWELTRPEQDRADQIEASYGVTLGQAAIGVAAAFALYHVYAKRQLTKHLNGSTSKKELSWATRKIWASFGPTWVRIVVPHLVTGYIEGVQEAHAGNLPENQLLSIAEGYANGLGGQIHDTSADAMMIGYQAQINRKVPSAKAISQVANAYGVSPRAMNMLVTVWNTDDPKKLNNLPLDSLKDSRIKTLIETELKNRGKMIGENEMWAAKSQAKQIVWMYGVSQGTIPADTTRTWITAKDEKVCVYCGPLHEVKAKVYERFKTGLGKLWSPPAHPRCRCNAVLDYMVDDDFGDELRSMLDGYEVVKALGRDTYDRDIHGRFSATERRSAKPKFKEVGAPDPLVATLIREAQDKYANHPQTDALLALIEENHANAKISSGKIASDKGKIKSQKISSQKIKGKLTPLNNAEGKISTAQPKLAVVQREKLMSSKLPHFESSKIMAGAPAKIKTPITTEHGNEWQLMSQPLFALDFNDSPSGTIETTSDDIFTNAEGVDGILIDHWNNVEEAMWGLFFEASDDAYAGGATHHYLTHDFVGTTSIITDEDYAAAIGAALNPGWSDEDPHAREMLWLDPVVGDTDSDAHRIPISPADLANILEVPGTSQTVAEFVKGETPTIFVTLHGRAGTTDMGELKYGYATNPGKWKIIGEYRRGAITSQAPYSCLYVEPID